jgi:DNA-binding NtrC family response regulator
MMTALNALAAYWWPDNIRELKHAIEHAAIVSETTQLALTDLPSEIEAIARPDSSFIVHLGSSMKDVVDATSLPMWRRSSLRESATSSKTVGRPSRTVKVGKTAFLGVAWPRDAKPTPRGAAGSAVGQKLGQNLAEGDRLV